MTSAEDTGSKGAVLETLDRKGKVTATIPVQFNPASLRLTMSNSVDGGTSSGRQAQQYNGTSSTQLHVELEFDTADEGTTSEPVDVRTHTSQIAQFVLPGGKNSKQAPPRVQFRWGSVAVPGVMTSLVEELDFFSADGIPLRAKATIEIKQQDPKLAALETGAGANPDTDAAPAGEPDGGGNGPGSAGTAPNGSDARTAEALDGESAADFLARNDQPPEAWRAVAGLVGDALSLAAGASVDFSASLSVGVGIGIKAGFEAGLDVSLGAQVGLEVGAGGIAGAAGAGFALAAAGGLSAAIEQTAIAEAATGANANRSAFGLAGAPVAVRPVAVSSAPGLETGPASIVRNPPTRPITAATPTLAPSRPLPPRADPRATGYGRGVPLRDRVTPDSGLPGGGGWVVIAPLRAPALPGGRGAGSRCGCGADGG